MTKCALIVLIIISCSFCSCYSELYLGSEMEKVEIKNDLIQFQLLSTQKKMLSISLYTKKKLLDDSISSLKSQIQMTQAEINSLKN